MVDVGRSNGDGWGGNASLKYNECGGCVEWWVGSIVNEDE